MATSQAAAQSHGPTYCGSERPGFCSRASQGTGKQHFGSCMRTHCGIMPKGGEPSTYVRYARGRHWKFRYQPCHRKPWHHRRGQGGTILPKKQWQQLLHSRCHASQDGCSSSNPHHIISKGGPKKLGPKSQQRATRPAKPVLQLWMAGLLSIGRGVRVAAHPNLLEQRTSR